MKFFNNRWIRILLLLAIILVIATTTFQQSFSHRSIDGIVNAHVINIRSPIEGIVAVDDDILPGHVVNQGDYVGKVDNVLIDYSYIMELRTERNFLSERVSTLNDAIDSLNSVKNSLLINLSNFKQQRSEELANRISSFDSQIGSLQSELNFQRRRLNRYNRLLETNVGGVSIQDVEEIQSIILSLQHNINSLTSQKESEEIRLESLQTNTFLNESNNDLPYSGQVKYQLKIRIIEKNQILVETRNRISQIEDQIVIEALQKEKEREFRINSPVDGIVWRRYVHQGSMVAIDAILFEIANCDSLFIEAQVAERLFDRIDIGQEVKFRFMNDGTTHRGVVRSKHGVATIYQDNSLAAVIDDTSHRYNRIVVEPTNPEDINKRENMCNIGRRVIVDFPRI